MEFWIKAAQLILSLSILIFLHELGHFIPARLFKTRVEKFYLFFNPWFSLVKKKIGETEWGIGWIPLGGYVKIAGMIDESMDKEQMAKPKQPWEFRSKPAWQRLIIMIGGVVVNIIVGIIIYIMVVGVWGEDQLPTKNLENGLAVHPYMQKYGLTSGDNILAVNGEEVKDINDINNGIMFRNNYELKIKHADGSVETKVLHDDIEYELFEEGAMRAFDRRHKSMEVDHTVSTHDYIVVEDGKEIEIEAGVQILSINDKSVESITFLDPYYHSNKAITVKYSSGEGEQEVTIQPEKIKGFFYHYPSLLAGLKKGDHFLSVNGRPVTYFDEISEELYANKGKNVSVTLLRGSDTLQKSIRVTKIGRLGYAYNHVGFEDSLHVKHISYGFGGSISRGFSKGLTTLTDYVGQLKFVFTKKGASSIGGFGAIGNMFSPTWDWKSFWINTAIISIILAFMNILPIPALDGGHVVFLLYEIITGREAPQKVLEVAQMIGFFLLIGLLLYANGNDIIKAITG